MPFPAVSPQAIYEVPLDIRRSFRDEDVVVETIGLEPTTPCLQSRCSTN